MGKLTQLISHPNELKSVVQLLYFRKSLHPRDKASETASLKRCYELLKQTSRSFAAVIAELHPELRDVVMVFYLVLRALDTIEDDMSIDPKIKIPLLREFDSKLDLQEWSFDGNAPTEKDRVVLVDFTVILHEYHNLKDQYKLIIKDITHKMGNGMADYILDENFNLNGIEDIKGYDLYCHYVAGLVGEGLTKLMILANFANPVLAERMYLTESMGLFLQKTNIIRDYEEDLADGRSFWPEEIWAKYADNLVDFKDSKNLDQGLYCISELVLNSLEHVIDVLTYLSLIKDYSSFNFCAIPQVMAIATLALVYQNPLVFVKNVKIRKGTTCQLILQSRTLEGVVDIFRRYIRDINHSSKPQDPNYLKIGIKCGQIEQFCEMMYPNLSHFPKQIDINSTLSKNEIYLNVKDRADMDKKMDARIKSEEFNCSLVLWSIGLFTFGLIAVVFNGIPSTIAENFRTEL